MRVLVVDDNESDREILLEGLPEGFVQDSIDFAESMLEVEARIRVEKKQYDCILLDLNLPDSQGIATLKRVRRMVTPAVPIIVLTGMDDSCLARELVEEGAEERIIKGTINPRAVYESIFNAVMRANSSIRIPSSSKQLISDSMRATARLKHSSESGEIPAIRVDTAHAVGKQTEVLALVLSMQEQTTNALRDTNSNIASLSREVRAGFDKTNQQINDLRLVDAETTGKIEIVTKEAAEARLTAKRAAEVANEVKQSKESAAQALEIKRTMIVSRKEIIIAVLSAALPGVGFITLKLLGLA